MLKWNYPWEKLYSACSAAIGSAMSPQERLKHAAWEVSLLLVNADISDKGLRKRMEQLVATCSNKPDQGEGTMPATISQMTDDEAGELLREIFVMFIKVAEYYAVEVRPLR